MFSANDMRKLSDEATSHDREELEKIYVVIDKIIQEAASAGKYSLHERLIDLWPANMLNNEVALNLFCKHYSELGFTIRCGGSPLFNSSRNTYSWLSSLDTYLEPTYYDNGKEFFPRTFKEYFDSKETGKALIIHISW